MSDSIQLNEKDKDFTNSSPPPIPVPKLLGSKRLTLAILLFFACAISYSHRSDLSLGIVCMVNHTAIELNSKNLTKLTETMGEVTQKTISKCGGGAVKEEAADGPFVWDKPQQGSALGSFFYGYLCSQVVGGMLAQKFGGKIVIGVAVLISSFLTVFTPPAAQLSLYALIGARAILGFSQGVVMPSIHTLWSFWAPEKERSILVGITFAGLQVGNLVSISISSVLCESGILGGWPSIFYLFGVLGFIWCGLWFCLATSNPNDSKGMDEAEKAYLQEHIRNAMGKSGKPPPMPWGKALLSPPVWAIYFGHFAADFGSYLMMGVMPTLMNELFSLPRESLGVISALPFFAFFIVIQFGGFLVDNIINKKILSLVNARRLFMIIALVMQGLLLVIAGYLDCDQTIPAIILITIAVGLSGFQFSSFVVSYLDVAPAFAGALLGVGNTISSFSGILGPMLMGIMTPTGSREEWQSFFWVTFTILTVGACVYAIFIRGDVQSWAKGGNKEGILEAPQEGDVLLQDIKKEQTEA
uniref:MFS domain-containing protein n=1 Tax=Strongyloides papillosus TaxID=174720 RepID=A0A0N5B4E4_STREA